MAMGTPYVMCAHGPPRRSRELSCTQGCDARFSLYKILFPFKALMCESIILLCPLPPLQSPSYCNTHARPLRNARPPTDPSFVCHIPYIIGDGQYRVKADARFNTSFYP